MKHYDTAKRIHRIGQPTQFRFKYHRAEEGLNVMKIDDKKQDEGGLRARPDETYEARFRNTLHDLYGWTGLF